MFQHVPALLKLAGPLILSSSTVTLMQLVDALVLSHHSSQAVAAMGPASMAVILFQGILWGVSGYAGTFVAHHFGANRPEGVLKSTWLGLHSAWIAGALSLVSAWPLAQLFRLAGHTPAVQGDEMVYFGICMAGSLFPTLNAALAGWLSGVGRTKVVAFVTFASFAVNALLTWMLVLGHGGLPRWGIAGAALATVLAQLFGSVLFLALFAKAGGFVDRSARRFEARAFFHFLKLALPMGLRIAGEVVAWTLFLIFLGRLGTAELAASSIAFRINGMAFFPAMGLGQAAGILAGRARGAGRDDDVPAIGWQSLLVCELWMLAMASAFLWGGEPLLGLFAGTGPDAAAIVACGLVILRFVAFYCLFDAANVMIGCVLAAVGDTQWIARAFFAFSGVFLGSLWLADRLYPDLVLEWTLATLFVFATAVTWSIRFHRGHWRRSRVLRESGDIQ
jgi:multidrug resistance protein, MATE family